MIGAIIGDVVGSRFEFNNIKTKKFELLTDRSRFTDDTVLTIAVMDWLLHSKNHSSKDGVAYLKKWARKYPGAGYGWMFANWLSRDDSRPYNSYGNGSAMRISACGWYFDDKEEMLKAVRTITAVTHNHPEGIKGAEVTAMCIYMARHGSSKKEIKKYIESNYRVDMDYQDLLDRNFHSLEICEISMPQALFCFLRSNSFEDCLRTTVSIGGDVDTQCAISCAIAEAYYGIKDTKLVEDVMNKLPEDMQEIINEFNNKLMEEK